MDTEIVGAIKIKDGMFMGDEYSSQVKVSEGFRVCNRKQSYARN